jgi:aryl-alcohol dehydrogenase-like predicted oxidoreductase
MADAPAVAHRPLGRSGIHVAPLALGTMVLGPWGNEDADACVRIVHRALDAGINLVDTADIYGGGVSEELVGRALAGARRDGAVLATKFHNPMGPDVNERGNSRRWITRAVEASLQRLGTDRIDLYQVHRPDPRCDIEETVAALDDLVRAGKILAWGTSTFPAEEIVEARWAAERLRVRPPVCEQPPYSLFNRAAEAAVLPTCLRYGMGTIVWSPLQGGWLTGKYRKGQDATADSRAALKPDHFDPGHEAKLDLVEELVVIAQELGRPMSDVALAFVLAHPAVTAAIIGPRTEEQLVQLIGDGAVLSGAFRLDSATLDRLDALVPPGVTLNARDLGYTPPAVADATLRRR